MKQVIILRGEATVQDVPAPIAAAGMVLVRVDHSCISAGTELSGVSASGDPLWKRALTRPDDVKKVAAMARTQGLSRTRSAIEGRLSAGAATGYSAAGTVLEVGEGIHDVRPGDRVACAGAGYAHHAEVVTVPRNLTVPIPAGLDLAQASTVTLGAIALQGVRRAQPTLGETFVVIGLGILGQLASQLLHANGCTVVGTDLDPARVALALELGMDAALPSGEGDVEQVARLTGGIGADGVIITAATPSDAVVSAAFRMCRKKGRVVLVGDVGLDLNRADFYAKELDFLISSSYGPGRYDNRYEEQGLDYPIGYVRWTENRNMAEYLHLVAAGKVRIAPLISATYGVEEAAAAYEALKAGAERPLIVLLSYPRSTDPIGDRTVRNTKARPAGSDRIRVAVVGAGGFARAVHLPNLQALARHYHLQAVVSRGGHNAAATARQFAASYATTDYRRVLDDPEVDAVILTTRHDLHAAMTLQALEAGKHVLVEKPLALTREELSAIENYYASADPTPVAPVLLTGFNRRFSPHIRRIRALTASRSNPMILSYRMNAGYIPLTHWVHTAEGGGRNRGEACHIYDLFTYLCGRMAAVSAQAIVPATAYYTGTDNFVATVTFADGSIATLTYTALGSREHPKEELDVFVDGRVITLRDYRELTIADSRRRSESSKVVDKGHREEMEAFAAVIQQGGEWPIPLWEQLQATEIAFRVEEQIRPDGLCTAAAVAVDPEIAAHCGRATAGDGD